MISAYKFAALMHKLHPLIQLLPNHLKVKLYSIGRQYFMNKFYQEKVLNTEIIHSADKSRILWGINFRYPLFNAAGMFKNGEGYDIVSAQGAGAYLGL
ncbi:MAG: hypothetical protein ACK5Z5_10250, partial [Neisseriaceae bacterium]